MRRIGHVASTESGSVLMETVLVLPLYLILLGGMFMVGDTLLGRFVLQFSGRYEAWTTHTNREMADTVSVFEYAEVEPFFHLENDGSSPYSTGFRFSDGSKANGNMWAYARIGMTRATVDLPAWTALFDMQRETIDPDSKATESRNTLHAADATFCWAFDYHRISDADIAVLRGDSDAPDVYRRSNPCTALQETAIYLDSHFCAPVSGADPHDVREPYQRNPLLMALGMGTPP